MKDVLGAAIADFYYNNKPGKLWVHDTHGPEVEMPVATYFRDGSNLPDLERIALQECRGTVLDIGAGAGSHALLLQEKGLDVTALDISEGAVDVMQQRGVKKVIRKSFYELEEEKYDTLLLLMNGIGLAGDLPGLALFLQKAAGLLKENGRLLFDSSDVAYLYEEGIPAGGPYYGEIICRYEYKRRKTDWFTWLYIDRATLTGIAQRNGWKTELLFEDGNDQYLVRLTRA